jgi:hypothetical protein
MSIALIFRLRKIFYIIVSVKVINIAVGYYYAEYYYYYCYYYHQYNCNPVSYIIALCCHVASCCTRFMFANLSRKILFSGILRGFV